MSVLHASLLLQPAKELIIAETLIEVLVLALDEASNQEDLAGLDGNGAGVERDLSLHSHHALFKLGGFDLVELRELLVPLEGMKPCRDHAAE